MTDGYEYDNEDDGMRAALERQRKKPSHIDEAVSLLSKDEPGMGDAMDRAHEGGGKDTFGVVASLPPTDAHAAMTEKPMNGPVEPPPSEPPSVAPPPQAPPEQPFKPNDFQSVQPSAPKADPKLQAIDHARWLMDAPPSAGLNDADIAAAQSRDRDATKHNDFIRSLQSWLMRKPFEPSEPTEGKDMLARRQLADQGQARQLSAQEKLVAALKGEEPKPLDPSLVALHEASAAQLRELAAQRDSREKRDAEEQKRKTDVATTTKTAEDASLESQRAIMTADPRLKKLGITPEVLAKLDRKGLEDVARELGPKGAAAPAGGGGGHRLSAEALKELAGIDSADKQLQDLEAEGSRVGLDSFKNQAISVLPERLKVNTDIGNYEDSARRAMQGVGLILEHGKLAAGDEVKYRKLLPEPGDNAVTLHHKIAGLRKYLADLKSGQQQTYSAGGYRVPDGGGSPPVKMKFPDGSVHDVDAHEVELAKKKGGVEVPSGG